MGVHLVKIRKGVGFGVGAQFRFTIARIMAKMSTRHQKGYNRGAQKVADIVLKRAQQLVPLKTGALRDSGYAKVKGKGFDTGAEVGFNKFYALWQHEKLVWEHKPGRKAKYLELAVKETRKLQRQAMMDSLWRGR